MIKLFKLLVLCLSLVLSNLLVAQSDSFTLSKADSSDTNCLNWIAPVWYFPSRFETVHGIAIGLGDLHKDSCNSSVNGIKLELLGLGIGVGFLPSSAFFPDSNQYSRISTLPTYTPKNRVNGINISLFGSIDDLEVNGISVGGMGQYISFINGIEITGGVSICGKVKGLQLSGGFNRAVIMDGAQVGIFGNRTYALKGVQMALYNKSEITRGFQFGLWNVNEKRSLPFINWNFKE